jgi:hypothetical protein
VTPKTAAKSICSSALAGRLLIMLKGLFGASTSLWHSSSTLEDLLPCDKVQGRPGDIPLSSSCISALLCEGFSTLKLSGPIEKGEPRCMGSARSCLVGFCGVAADSAAGAEGLAGTSHNNGLRLNCCTAAACIAKRVTVQPLSLSLLSSTNADRDNIGDLTANSARVLKPGPLRSSPPDQDDAFT